MTAVLTFLLLETAQPAILRLQPTQPRVPTRSRCNTKHLRIKDFLSKFADQTWLVMESDKANVNVNQLSPSLRRRRHMAPLRPSDVPSTHCPWRWQYDFDPNREPQYLPKAVCDNCNAQVCKPVHLKHTVVVKSCDSILSRGKRLYLWKKSLVTLPVAFYY